MPTETEPFVDYQVTTTREGEYVHVTAEADPDNPRTHRWLWRPYAAEEGLFTQGYSQAVLWRDLRDERAYSETGCRPESTSPSRMISTLNTRK